MSLFSSKTLSLTTTFLLLILLTTTTTTAQTPPGPTPPGPINITAILEKPGQYARFIQLLNQTQQDTQINNQVNNSHDGMTVFAPTDNAFNNLPSGTLNNLSVQQQVQLVLYHICPKYYSMSDLETVSNPVRTLATGQDGGAFGLYFSGQNNQVNVSTGIVDQPVYNALRASFPLAVYQVDKVLLPKELYDAKSPASSPTISGGGAVGAGGNAPADAAGGAPNNGASSMRHHHVGIEMVLGVLLLICMGMLS